MVKSETVNIFGVGHIGLTLAMFLTNKGVRVYGIDSDAQRVENLKAGIPGIRENRVNEYLLSALESKLFIPLHTSDLEKFDLGTVHVITVGTPVIEEEMDNSFLRTAVSDVAKVLKTDDLVIIRSTVSVGSCRSLIYPILAERKVEFSLAMCPERTLEGNAIEEIFALPQIIGGIDPKSSNEARLFFEKNVSEIVVMDSIEEAEIIKLANNSFRDLTFAFSNELSYVCNALGLSSAKIIEAANYKYNRSNIPVAGPSGGPCLSKDPFILANSSENFGIEVSLMRVARKINRLLPVNFVLDILRKEFVDLRDLKVGILGLSFKGKPAVIDTRDSFALDLAEVLFSQYGIMSVGFEPAGLVNLSLKHIKQSVNLDKVIAESQAIIVTNNSSFFAENVDVFSKSANPRTVIIDMWGEVSSLLSSSEFKVHSWT